ncbi:hypothetical protein [Actinomyces glycerinitolerans]|uniref:Uncharacterized protein n=1 Tax=Actinomyces glycerinitolerans TaxID=1892869 RepID=A0A1M4S0S3_9ACTO|nr:hypothetical protein [Actinomyces glycerinitolerans]SHE25567.1 Hypothetical protein ACGLYG10_1788 [Actinomyces glycerinitolerans]
MFDLTPIYPLAVTSPDDDGLDAGFAWCAAHMQDGDHITVWTHQKSNLHNNPKLEEFVERYSDVDHVTARGGVHIRRNGPVLMAWADQTDIAELIKSNSNSIRALCVVYWDEDKLRAWVTEAQPELLGDTSVWDVAVDPLDPVVEEALKSLTRVINHNNTIAGGYEKDRVVPVLLALHDAGYKLDGARMAGWAVANGWTGGNPAKLEEFVEAIEAGKRLRSRGRVPRDYIQQLKARVAEAEEKTDG